MINYSVHSQTQKNPCCSVSDGDFNTALTDYFGVSFYKAESKYCENVICMVALNEAWPFILHEFWRMLILIQVHGGACI